MDLKTKSLSILSKAVGEALDLEKCSICLEKLEDTVMLWPCTHRFCMKCITKMKKIQSGKSVCPLCKGAAPRRSLLPFHDKQKEYEDHLQRLIGAISLDLGFDITSYRNQDENEFVSNIQVNNKQTPGNKNTRQLSLKGSKTSKLVDSPIRSRKMVSKRSSNVKKSQVQSNPRTSKTSSFLPPKIPSNVINSKQDKVQNWINSTHFSQGKKELTETVVVEIHKAEQDSPTLTEDQLISVTQVDSRTAKKPSKQILKNDREDSTTDIEAIEPYDSIIKDKSHRNIENKQKPNSNEFDKLLPKGKRIQVVKTTYGNPKSYNSKQNEEKCFTVDSEIFKCNDSNDKNESYHSDENVNSSQTFEDFSSGSGEEWTLHKEKKSKLKKQKLDTLKTLKKSVKTNVKEKPSKKKIATRNKTSDSTHTKEFNSDNLLEVHNKVNDTGDKNKNSFTSNSKKRENLVLSNSKNTLEDIMNEWDDTTNSKNMKNLIESNNDNQSTEKIKITLLKSTPIKQSIPRSPGWSKLNSTKKEFQMSEKKKLSLRTCNKFKLSNFGITPQPVNQKQSDKSTTNNSSDLNIIKNKIEINPILYNVGHHMCDFEKSSDKVNKSLLTLSPQPEPNNSLKSPISDSPFLGFEISNKNIHTCAEQAINKSSENTVSKSLERQITDGCLLEDSHNKSEEVTVIAQEQNQCITKENATCVNDIDESFCPQFESKLTSTPKTVVKNKGLQKSLTKSKEFVHDCIGACTDPNFKESNKKRLRDSGIQDESLCLSPARKKVCRNVEVQTSPGPMKAYIKDIVESLLGTETGSLIQKRLFDIHDNIFNGNKVQKFTQCKNLDKPSRTDINGKTVLNELSQSSDKENVEVINKNLPLSQDSFNNSDFVLGTEDCNGPMILRNIESKQEMQSDTMTKENANFVDPNVKFKPILKDDPWWDPEAPTQVNKTPGLHKRVLGASPSNVYSVVSKPTDSELKRLDVGFDESYVELIDNSLIGKTPWEHSGICRLDDDISSKKQPTDELIDPVQSSKEKKSRRQLDFCMEDSNSNDMFNALEEKKSVNCNKMEIIAEDINNDDLNENEIVEDQDGDTTITNKNNREFYEHRKVENKSREINSDLVNEKEFIENKEKVGTCENIVPRSVDEESIASSEDFIIEGTPDVSQIDMNQDQNPEMEDDAQRIEQKVENVTVISLNEGNMNCVENKPVGTETEIKEQTNDADPKQQNNLQNDSTKEDEDDEQLCFASSLLNAHQKQILAYVLEGLGIPYSKNMGEHVSHLVVGSTNGRTQNTYKFLHAIALHKPVITFDWVAEVLKVGEAVPLDTFLALDQSGECGVLRAKLDEDRVLLQDFAIHIYNVVSSIVQKEELEELVRLCGGVVVPKIDDFNHVPRDKFRVVVFSEPPDASTQQDFRQTFHATEVSVDWIYNMVARYRVIPLSTFLLDPERGIPFLLEQGYPEELIYETPSQLDSPSPTLG